MSSDHYHIRPARGDLDQLRQCMHSKGFSSIGVTIKDYAQTALAFENTGKSVSWSGIHPNSNTLSKMEKEFDKIKHANLEMISKIERLQPKDFNGVSNWKSTHESLIKAHAEVKESLDLLRGYVRLGDSSFGRRALATLIEQAEKGRVDLDLLRKLMTLLTDGMDLKEGRDDH